MYLHINSATLSTAACCPLNEHAKDFIRENICEKDRESQCQQVTDLIATISFC